MGETFYHRLNQSTRDIINDSYIQDTSEFMAHTLNKHHGLKRLLVIGAGNLNDFSLDFFKKHFKKIHLSDIDVESIQSQLSIQNHAKIIVKKVDYLGLDEIGFYDGFLDLLSMSDVKEMKRFLQIKIDQLMNTHFSVLFNDRFDCIYISPIYTQLLYREFEVKLNALVQQGFNQIYADELIAYLLQAMIQVIDHFNTEIVSLLNHSGLVFLASDILAITDNEFSKDIKRAINDSKVMNQLYHHYQESYGYGLGDYGVVSLAQIMHLKREKWFIWKQDHQTEHAVKFCELVIK